MERAKIGDSQSASMVMSNGHGEDFGLKGFYTVKCFGADGNLKWEDVIHNKVCTEGVNEMLDGILGNAAKGVAYIALKGTGAAADADTMASHAGWTEVTAYDEATRRTMTMSAAAARSKTTSSAVVFTISGSVTVAGVFVNLGNSTKGDSATGKLLTAGDFTGGSRACVDNDVLNVTFTLSVSASA